MARKNLRAVGRPLTTLAVVLFFVNASLIGATGQAQALDLEECAKDVVTGAWTETVLDYVMGNPNYCLEITESDFSNQTKVDMASSMLTAGNQMEQTTNAVRNRLVDSQAVALTKAKITIVNELNNGSTKAEAKAAANETIDDYYSVMQRNLLTSYDTLVIQARYTAQTAVDTGDNRNDWIWVYDTDTSMVWSGADTHNHVDYAGNHDNLTVTATLLNGSTVETELMAASNSASSDDKLYHPGYMVSNGLTVPTVTPYGSQSTTFNYELRVNDTSADKIVFDSNSMTNVLDDVGKNASNAKANIDVYVDGIYNQYAMGELNTTDILNPTEIYQEASTDRNSTGYYGWAAVQLSALGYSGDTETSHEIEYNGTTLSGTLFYTGSDVTAIETGVEYDPANFNGSFLFAAQNGSSAEIVELTENFTVTSATNLVTGTEVQNTTMEKKVYSTTNASELESELQALRELRQEYENQTTFASSGGGGGGDGSGGFNLGLGLGAGGLVVASVLVLAVLAARG